MSYQPVERGRFPVGVGTLELGPSPGAARVLPTELWYPATADLAGVDLGARADRYAIASGVPGLRSARQLAVRDAPPATGRWPLLVFSHGFASHRRQSTFLCTHWASHGYAVAAPDHVGGTLAELLGPWLAMARASAVELSALPSGALRASWAARATTEQPGWRPQLAHWRLADVELLLAELPNAAASRGISVDSTRVGLSGHSFGGWTAMAAARRASRASAVVALAPAGGRGSISGEVLGPILEAAGPRRACPTLLVAADRDRVVPPESVRALAALAGFPERLVVLECAGHAHFCDYPRATHELVRRVATLALPPVVRRLLGGDTLEPFDELCSEQAAFAALRATTLAHFDAALRADAQAARWLEHELVSALASHGAGVLVEGPQPVAREPNR